MPKLSEYAKRIGRKIGLNDEKGYGIAVFLALILVAAIVTGYFVSAAMNPPKGYSTIYLLDANQRAVNYSEVITTGENSTLWLAVENHNSDATRFEVQVKITKNLPPTYPLSSVRPTLVFDTGLIEPQESWRNLVSLTQNEPGSYAVVFELYKFNGDAAEFTHNYCVLNIEVI